MKQSYKNPVETSVLKLSLAVRPIDEYSGNWPAGRISLSLKDQEDLERKPVRNLGGYYLFFGLPEGSFTIQIEGGDWYFDEVKKNVKPSELDEKNPVVTISLIPSPSYPFSHSDTLIRGSLQGLRGESVSKALIRVKDRDISTRTTDKGEFVVYFSNLKKNDIKVINGKKLLKINGDNPVLEISHPDLGNKTESIEVEEGKTVSISITYS